MGDFKSLLVWYRSKAKRGRPPRISPQKPILKRGRGRPRKQLGGSTFDHVAEKDTNINVISELTETPRLGEEVVSVALFSSFGLTAVLGLLF